MLWKHRLNRREFLRCNVTTLAALNLARGLGQGEASSLAPPIVPIPDKTVVLTLDDAVKSHRTFVAPLLKELGFRATFFVTHRWMGEQENFMTWQEIAELHQMGFEIGNHTWTHGNFSSPRNAAHLNGELALVERELKKVGVPRPSTFAYPGDDFGPEAVNVLMKQGYLLARRGMQPEVKYGAMEPGPAFDPAYHHPLLIPTAGDAYPDWNLDYFQKVVSNARGGKAVVLQFHGVPDLAHPWVYTPPDNFRQYMTFLKENDFRVVALGDLRPYLHLAQHPDDPLLKARYPEPKSGCPDLPTEVTATRADLRYWLENMLRYHRYSWAEAATVCGMSEEEVRNRAKEFGLDPPAPPASPGRVVRVLPYPGGRYPRIGFESLAIDPMRGTKASVFLPWDSASYVVVDLPEAIFSNLGLIFLAHTDIPTLWNDKNVVLENIDWERGADGSLSSQWTLPNYVTFGAHIRPGEDSVEMELWMRNFSGADVTGMNASAGLRTQICIMLKGAPEFNAQTNDNKILRKPVAAVHSAGGNRWILTAWQNPSRSWGNPPVPCLHADPKLPDCPFRKTVRIQGRLWFYEGTDIEREIERRVSELPPVS
ncbi:MAG: polysaccharide deacetylase family protein [Terriglobia bacterium]|jgi:peptidoglycan/xylan/chitin deacetylase (PgdA/CDA1 family)